MNDLLGKAIRGLECCSTYDDYSRKSCRECPYNEPDGKRSCKLHQMRIDALTLLKAQKPRVMTLEEVQKTSTESIDGAVWLESRMHSDPDNGDCDIWFSGWANPVEACETDIHIYAFGNEVPVEAKKVHVWNNLALLDFPANGRTEEGGEMG